MFVRQHQFGGRHDGARLIAVHPLHLLRPLPAFFVEIEPKGTGTLRVSPGQRALDGRLLVGIARLIDRYPTSTRGPEAGHCCPSDIPLCG
jgi:hypothetical protein